MINRQVVLASRPKGVAQAEHFAIRDAPVAAPAEGQIRVRNEFLSVEPAMRGWIADRGNYSAAVEIGSAMRALAVGEIVESRHPDYRPGEIVTGWFGWQETATVDATAVVRRVAETDLPRSLALGVLGINGVSALVGLTAIGEPQPGETVLVSTAAGAVGSAVGKIGKILGCRTVGVAGGPEKVAQCRDLFGYDAAIDYKARGIDEALAAACPDGVHVYFDNTSGAISDAVHPHLAVWSACRRLRHRLNLQLGPVAYGASDRAPSARQARPSAGVRDIRSHGSLRDVGGASGRLGALGPAALSGRHPRRSRKLSGRTRRTLSG
jgi:NADPH-dependent curcumin reductase